MGSDDFVGLVGTVGLDGLVTPFYFHEFVGCVEAAPCRGCLVCLVTGMSWSGILVEFMDMSLLHFVLCAIYLHDLL